MALDIRVQADAFDYGAECGGFAEACTGAGAVVTFAGIVRDLDAGAGLKVMEIEHYPGMTERALTAIAEEAQARWDLAEVLVIHRHGPLRVGERIMMVATAARHRKAAFEAAEFVMDWLKTKAPFWKKETTPEGAAWVDAREADDEAAARWAR